MADGKSSLLPRGPGGMWNALIWSLRGLRTCFRLESSFRLDLYACLVLTPLGWWLGQTMVERVILLGSLMLVLSMELLNSAMEAVVDKVSPEFSAMAERAKDMGSAAVFVLMLNVALCWGLIGWARFFN